MMLQDMFWQPQKGELVRLKPEAAAQWPFKVECEKDFLVTHGTSELDQCWITPADTKRRWHSGPIMIDLLMPSETVQPNHHAVQAAPEGEHGAK